MADVSYLGLDQDWMTQPQPIPLLTPDEQTAGASAVYSPLQCSYTPSPPGFPGLPTPDSSLPASPQSSYYSEDPEFQEVMSSFLDEEDVSQFSPNELGTPTTPFQYSHLQRCDYELLSAPLGDSLDSTKSIGSTESIRDLLVKTEDSPSSPCTQRTSELSSKQLVFSNEKPRFKRRLTQAARKERKREQNKTAALRYRQRKKGEKESCFQKVQVLEIKNSELKDKVKALTSEIDYLKKLWVEVREAKRRKRTG